MAQVNEARLQVGRDLRRLAGAAVSLGEHAALRCRQRDMPRAARGAIIVGCAAGRALLRAACGVLQEPLPAHLEVEAELISVYGAEQGAIPPLARTMAIEVRLERKGKSG